MEEIDDIHSAAISQEEHISGMTVEKPDGKEGMGLGPEGDAVQDESTERQSAAKQRFSFRHIFGLLRNSIGAIIQGEFLIRLRFDRYFLHIIYLFFLAVVSIWIKLEIDQTMVRLEESKKELEDYKIYYAQKTCELVELDRLSTVEEMLEKKGSRLTIPEKPADRIAAGKTKK